MDRRSSPDVVNLTKLDLKVGVCRARLLCLTPLKDSNRQKQYTKNGKNSVLHSEKGFGDYYNETNYYWFYLAIK